jgi:hypothetical protein
MFFKSLVAPQALNHQQHAVRRGARKDADIADDGFCLVSRTYRSGRKGVETKLAAINVFVPSNSIAVRVKNPLNGRCRIEDEMAIEEGI